MCRAQPHGGQQPSKEFMSTAFGGNDWCWSHLLKHRESASGATITLEGAQQAPKTPCRHPGQLRVTQKPGGDQVTVPAPRRKSQMS